MKRSAMACIGVCEVMHRVSCPNFSRYLLAQMYIGHGEASLTRCAMERQDEQPRR
jgi:hypothetical protein